MHVLDLDLQRSDALYRMNAPYIRPIVRMIVQALPETGTDAGGFPIYGTTYATYDFAVDSRLLERIQYSMQKPRFAGDEMFDGLPVDVTLKLANTDAYLATFQNGAKLRAEGIEQGEIRIYADIGVGNPIEMFQGRIVGRPTEQRGEVTIKARGTLWDAMRSEVKYESFAGASALSDGFSFNVTSQTITCVGGSFCCFHGLVKWDSNGKPRPAFNQESGGISLKGVLVSTGAKLGEYAIEFIDSSNYRITYPDNTIYVGNINRLSQGAISIPPNYWTGTDGTDVRITFQIGVAYKGNAVAIAYNLLEKGLLENWGSLPQLNPAVKIDIPRFTELAQRFASHQVFVDASNSDNKVFENRSGSMPLDTASLAQWVLKHVCCTLSLTADGLITLISPYVDDRNVWALRTDQDIIEGSLVIQGSDESVNELIVQYGGADNTFGANYILDLRNDPAERIVDQTLNVPFYKHPVNLNEAIWYGETMSRRHFDGQKAQTTINCSVTPQMGLTLLPGDIVRIVSLTQPVTNSICEIISVDIRLGGEVGLTLAVIQQEVEGATAEVCVAQLNNVRLW